MKTVVYDLKTQLEEAMQAASEMLAQGELVIFPTETVYGIGADATNAQAVSKIYEVKGRPSNNPLIAHIWDFAQVREIADEISPLAEKLMHAFWPGPFTIVLHSKGVLPKRFRWIGYHCGADAFQSLCAGNAAHKRKDCGSTQRQFIRTAQHYNS